MAALLGHTEIAQLLGVAGARQSKGIQLMSTTPKDIEDNKSTTRSTSRWMFAVLLVLGVALLILWRPFGVNLDDLNKANEDSDTALILAARKGHTETVQALIQAGGPISIKLPKMATQP